jgi:hypothetical protein
MRQKIYLLKNLCLVMILLAGQFSLTEAQVVGEVVYMVTHDTDIGSGHNNEDVGHKTQIRMANTTLDNPASYDTYLKFNVKDSIEIPEGMVILSAKVKVSTTTNQGPDMPDFVVLHVANDDWNEDATIPVDQAPDVDVVYTDTLDRTSFTGGNASFLSLDVTKALMAELADQDSFMTIRVDNLAESFYAAGSKDIIYVTDQTSWMYGWTPPKLHVYYGHEPDSIFSDIAGFGNDRNYLTRINSSPDKRLWFNEVGIWIVTEDEGDARYQISERAAPYKPTSETDPSPGTYAVYDVKSYGDFDISLKAKVNATDDGEPKSKTDFIVVFGFTDPDNYAYMQFQVGDEGAFYRVIDNSKSMVGTSNETGAISDTAYHDYRLVRSGTAVTAYVDGTEYLSVDDMALGTEGKIGMGSYNDIVFFDDFKEEAGEPISARDLSITGLKIYPNPAGDLVHVNAASRIKGISIQNVLGQELKKYGIIGSESVDLNISDLPSGIYIIRISGEDGSTAVRNLLKR